MVFDDFGIDGKCLKTGMLILLDFPYYANGNVA